MATENTKHFTKVIKGKKYILPLITELPFNAIDGIQEAADKIESTDDEKAKGREAMATIRILKKYVPAVNEAADELSMRDLQGLIQDWFLDSKTRTGANPKK